MKFKLDDNCQRQILWVTTVPFPWKLVGLGQISMTSSCTGNCLTKCRRPKSLGHLTSREEDAASGIFKKGNPKTHERTHTFTVESSKLFSCSKVQLQSKLSNSRCVVPGQHQQPLTTTTPTTELPTPSSSPFVVSNNSSSHLYPSLGTYHPTSLKNVEVDL